MKGRKLLQFPEDVIKGIERLPMVQAIVLGKKTGLYITDLFATKLNSVPSMKSKSWVRYKMNAADTEAAVVNHIDALKDNVLFVLNVEWLAKWLCCWVGPHRNKVAARDSRQYY